MKLKTLPLAAFILIQIHCMAQSNVSSEKKEDFLAKALEKAKTVHTENDIQNSVNEIKRIESLDSNYWLPSYYVSYMETSMSFFTNPDKKEAILTDAKERIEKLLDNPTSDKSELYTLLGYYYYAKISQDPQKNGQIYYKDVISNYQKAIAINPANPRPQYLLNLFEDRMNGFMGKKDNDLCSKLQKNKELFTSFKPAGKNYPTWGEKELLSKIKDSCKQD